MPETLQDTVETPATGNGRLLRRIFGSDEEATAAREQYRRLAAALYHRLETGVKVVMIASAVPGEGKSLTAANLALILTESYRRRVLLVDADLRRPSLHGLFGVGNDSGLGDVLVAPEDRPLPAQPLGPRLDLVPAGHSALDPMAGLTSPRMTRLLADARASYDWILVDTPAVALLPDANLLTAMIDGAILVIKAGETPYELVSRAADAIGRTRIVGAVLNGVDPRSLAAPAYYYYRTSDARRP